ncbi:ATP-binding protein [Sulfuriflexus mobilis]|uniref:ATP-binding protein n=1 Tax=Sulfuriflexus mobilis TaxID=1811807 RepID=UPI000F841BE1|nr:ATP-binding protein [Sulfuriflexus mobilis]
MKLRITLLIPTLLIVVTIASSVLTFIYNNDLAEQQIRAEAKEQLRLDITRLQNILYNLLTENNLPEARLNISVMAMDSTINHIVLADENANVLIANRYSWEGQHASIFPGFDSKVVSQVRSSNRPHIAFRSNDSSLLNGFYPIVIKIEDSFGRPIKHVGILYTELSIARKLYTARNQAFKQSAFQGGFMLAAALIIALLLHVLVSKRLGSLANSATNLAEGDLATTITVGGNDELSHLASAFDNMREQVRTQIHHMEQAESDLREFNSMLEHRINKRTALLKDELEKREALEKQLLHAQKMESLGQLTGGIAHDFNNILSSIIGFTQLARGLDVSKNHEKLSGYLAQIQQSGERAASLVAQMLTYSRTEGDVKHKQNLSATELFADTFSMLRPIIPSNIKLHIAPATNDLIINANPVMMSQVLTNLCLNARDSIKEGQGEIRIEAEAVYDVSSLCSSCQQPIKGDFVVIHVTDNGCGIDEDVVSRVFDPFFSTKETGKGTGMGLSMVHGIIHKHGGHACINSVPGKGTTISIYLPPAVIDTAPDETKDPAAATSNTYDHSHDHNHILIVDDEASLTDFLGELLELHHYKVTSMNDSQVALEYFERHKDTIDLVISDQTMPGLLGTDMALAMLKLSPSLPFILCTGHSEHVNRQQALDMNIAAFMQKPIDSDTLLETIRRHLQKP